MFWTVRYWFRPQLEINRFSFVQNNSSPIRILIIASVFSCFAAIFQSAGGFFPGIGYGISPFATLPIFISIVISIKHGFLSYFSAILLLLLLQPSELIVFTFTTGLLGITLGLTFKVFKQRFLRVSFSAVSLLCGILILICLFKFPILGPAVTILNYEAILVILVSSFLYCWAWAEFGLFILNRLMIYLPAKKHNK
ncbi:hypothetical protein ACN6MY_10595 [Peribacillus sp. B-H-3]|uniref:hypothetical protein n=1 Tax=Peribacillus sp. B-H-3 TaxID=3400420 RepID=UPI003B017BE7